MKFSMLLNYCVEFEKANTTHIDIIFRWLAEPHMVAHWDNTAEHKEDILNFIHGRKQYYFKGTTCYWIGFILQKPFCFILSDIVCKDKALPKLHKQYLSQEGTTIALDFGIGNPRYLNQDLAAPTICDFINFYRQSVDSSADTFFIDPDQHHLKAQHVYAKAGFNKVGEFTVETGAFKEQVSYLMVKKYEA